MSSRHHSIKLFLLTISLLVAFFLVGQPVLAQSEEETTSIIQNLSQPCMECGSCTFEDFLTVFRNMANLGLSFIGPLLVFILIIAGLVFLFSHGNQELVDRGKKIISGALIGMTITLSAWLIINTIVTVSVKDQKILGTEWFSYNTVTNPLACPQLAVTTDSDTTTTDQESITCTNPTGQCGSLSCDPVKPGDGCNISAVNKLKPQIREGVARSKTGVCSIDMVRLLEAISANESDGDITTVVRIPGRDGKPDQFAVGPFQLLTSTADEGKYKGGCGEHLWSITPHDTNGWINWLKRPDTVDEQACMATNFIKKSIASVCGCDARQIAAGYNGGAAGACGKSADCRSCQMCPNQNQPTKRWECLWNNPQHTACNTGLVETKKYAPWVEWCYNNAF